MMIILRAHEHAAAGSPDWADWLACGIILFLLVAFVLWLRRKPDFAE